ncbi:amino acid adenylation domain-containing protein [Micromonospora sp. CPCC 205561]|uniref:amino acid adenylation domain-containing protein n=1 Tax=Micromonospora sp. CPCC 205561 TaxID=3122407 RepID=UPI002FF3248A
MTADQADPGADDEDLSAVAVVGMACRVPGADSVEEFWRLLCDGVDPVEEVPADQAAGAGPDHVARRKRFADPALFDGEYFGLTPAECAATDPQQRLLLETSVRALEDAAIDPARVRGDIGVFVGMNHSDYLLHHVLPEGSSVRRLGWHRVLMGNDRGFAATQVSYRLGLTGPSVAVDCACSSGLAAIHQACRALVDYEADAAIAGGVSIKPTDSGYSYVEGGIASPDGLCRPFSADANGTVFASGVVLFVLRRLEDALTEGDRVLAVIRGSGINNDGGAKTGYTAPSAAGQAALIRRVHRLAGIDAGEIGYVEAHGTGTALGDPIEIAGLTEAFRGSTASTGTCLVGSVKSNIGHLDSASGPAGLAKAVLAVRHGFIPASLYAERTNPHIDFAGSPFRVCAVGTPWPAARRIAAVSSFGVGGTNVHLLVESPPAPAPAPAPPATAAPIVVPFTARRVEDLDAVEARLRAVLAGADAEAARDTAHTLRRGHLRHRLRRVLVRHPGGELESLRAATDGRGAAVRVRSARTDGTTSAALIERLSVAGPVRDLVALGTPAAVALAFVHVWQRHHLAVSAVVSDRDTAAVAAVLAGVLTYPDGVEAVSRLARGATPAAAATGLTVRPAAVACYDADGNQFHAAGQTPDLVALLAGAPPAPGRRTLPPRVDAVVDLVPGPGAGPLPEALFPYAVSVGAAEPDLDSLRAAMALAWVTGVLDEPGPAEPGAVVTVPGHPFRRERHWLSAPGGDEVTPAPATAPTTPVAGDTAPATVAADPLDTALAVFADVLGRAATSADDSLFAVGGDSLAALRVVARARSLAGVDVRLGSFMAAPTPRTLAALIRTAASVPVAAEADVGTGPVRGPVPLTALQRRFHFLSQLPGAAEAYHVPILADLRGPLDVEALRAAVGDVVRRHESLRLAVTETSDGPVQQVVPAGPVPMPVVDCGSEQELQDAITALLDAPIALDGPPMTARLLRTDSRRHVLAVAVHHMFADARSTGIFLRDLYAYYEQRTGGAPADLVPIDGVFLAHVRAENRWLDSAEAARQLAYWTGELRGAPEALELPADRPRGATPSFRGGRRGFRLAGVDDGLRRLAGQEGATPFAVMLAAFGLFLSRVAGAREVVVGVPVSGRHRPETEHLIGNFVNTLPLRLRVRPDDDFRSLVRRTARAQRDGLDNQDIPFEVLVRSMRGARQTSETPLCQVLFNMLDTASSRPDGPAGLTVEAVPFDTGGSPMDLQLDWWLTDGGVGARLLHADVFAEQTVAGWVQMLRTVIREALARPDARLRDLPVEPPSARARSAAALTGPRATVPAGPVHAWFLDAAARHPDKLAVTDGVRSSTYRDLAEVSGGIAQELHRRGVVRGDVVAIAMRRELPAVCALLGVLRAGATPAPVDLNHPPRRTAAILADCGARVVCVDSAETLDVTAGLDRYDLSEPAVAGRRPGRLPGDDAPGDAGAYLTYTSGTTGRPKGIRFPHAALANLIHWETGGLTRPVRFLQLASFGFDAAFHETFAALCAGGSLHIATDEVKHDHDLLLRFIAEHQVGKAILPVSLLHALAARPAADRAMLASLGEIASTGEQLRVGESLVAFFTGLPGCALINNYGPAETHVVTSYRFGGAPADWPRYAPIGRPIDNVALRIVDEDGVDVPRGSVGELVIAGACVATGYLGDAGPAAGRFGGEGPGGARSYRSGDRARLLPSGELLFLGRADQQVKIRGFRVELDEVETALRRSPEVTDVAVVVRGDEGDRTLHAYLVLDGPPEPTVARLRERLREDLPSYMVPASFTPLPALPVNANGKVDTARLPPPVARAGLPTSPADSGFPQRVLALFREILDRPGLGGDDDFFEAGGHSLLATTLIHRLRTEFGIALSVPEFLRASTPAAVAELVEARGGGERTPSTGVELPAAVLPQAPPPALAWLGSTPHPAHQKTFVYQADGPVDPVRLRRALDAVLRRQAALRLRWVDRRLVLATEAAELRRMDGPDDPDALHDLLQAEPLDLSTSPPVRLVLVRAGRGRSLLGLTLHKAVLDGRGLAVLLDELVTAYDAPAALGGEDDGFLRHLSWRVGPHAPVARAREVLARGGWDAPPNDVPSAAAAAAVPVARCVWAPRAALQSAIRRVCGELRVTPFTVHLAAFAAAQARLGGGGEAVLAVPMDGRTGPELDATVGGFATVVPLRIAVRPRLSAGELLADVRILVDELFELRTLPLADAARATAPGGHLGPPVVFNYARAGRGPARLGTATLVPVGPDPLDPELRLHFAVYDSTESFQVVARRTGGPAVLDAYREALYAIVFDPDAPLPQGSPA